MQDGGHPNSTRCGRTTLQKAAMRYTRTPTRGDAVCASMHDGMRGTALNYYSILTACRRRVGTGGTPKTTSRPGPLNHSHYIPLSHPQLRQHLHLRQREKQKQKPGQRQQQRHIVSSGSHTRGLAMKLTLLAAQGHDPTAGRCAPWPPPARLKVWVCRT